MVGRRGGKSIVLALCAVYLACFVDWSRHLNRGERGTVLVLAADKKQARVIFRFAQAFLSRTPLLIERETLDTLDLTNGLSIEIQAASYRTVRGYSLVAALLDELAFWRSDESANPDTEILAAIRPAMASIPGAMLLCASSPYARRGALWNAYKRHFGKPSSTLVWQADTRTMNPTISQDVIDEAIEDDPASAAAEFGAEASAYLTGRPQDARYALVADLVAFRLQRLGDGSERLPLCPQSHHLADSFLLRFVRDQLAPRTNSSRTARARRSGSRSMRAARSRSSLASGRPGRRVRKVKEGETTNNLFAFLTTEPNAVVAPIHAKAMPVILTTQEEVTLWMTPAKDALALQRPLPDDALRTPSTRSLATLP